VKYIKIFSHLFFFYCFIAIRLWELLNEIFQDLQFSSLDLVVLFMNSPYSHLYKVIKMIVITVII